MTGYIKLSRSIFGHSVVGSKPYCEGFAWAWIIQRAAWKDTAHRIGGKVHDVPRGSFFCTERELMGEWGWGNTKVRNFLKLLQSQSMIQSSGKPGKTLVTVCNYAAFQDNEQGEDHGTKQTQSAGKAEAKQAQSTDKALKEELKEIKEDNNTPLPPAGGRDGIDPNLPDGLFADPTPMAAEPVGPVQPSKPARKVPGIVPAKLEAEFETWWQLCPRKVGKGGARTAFGKALKKTNLETITTGMMRHAAERQGEDPNYTPQPATWLNQERWTDEPAQKPQVRTQGDRRNGYQPDGPAPDDEFERMLAQLRGSGGVVEGADEQPAQRGGFGGGPVIDGAARTVATGGYER